MTTLTLDEIRAAKRAIRDLCTRSILRFCAKSILRIVAPFVVGILMFHFFLPGLNFRVLASSLALMLFSIALFAVGAFGVSLAKSYSAANAELKALEARVLSGEHVERPQQMYAPSQANGPDA